MNHKKFVWLGIAFFSALVLATFVLAGNSLAAGGTGPGDAFIPTGSTATAAPNSKTWYKFEESGNGKVVTAILDANGASGIGFTVYTPSAVDAWLRGEKLVSVGASSKNPLHDQLWEGRFRGAGTYYLVVNNTSASSIEYQLTVTGDGVTTVVNVVPTATPLPNPFETPVPIGNLSGGGKIVFQESSGGNIYTVNADGTNLQRVTFGLDPAFSPDGSKIAFVRQGPVPGLFVIHADGSNERNLFGGNQVRSPSWASDTKIVYSTITRITPSEPICFFGRCFGGGDVTRWGLFEYDLADNTIHNVSTLPTGATVPSVNRVLGQIAFMNPEKGLMLTTLADDAVARLIDNDLSINTPTMSADGSRLTYMVNQPPSWQIVVAVWDGTHPTLLTRPDPLSFKRFNNVAPTFSPDGQEILFLSNRNGKWEFFAISADGSSERQVLKNITDGLNLQYNYSAERVASWVK
jgi:hypothetical protein